MVSSADNKEQLQALIGPDYDLQWVIGHGGMSTVWLAHAAVPVGGSHEVAIKVLRPEFSDNNEFLSRFRNEAQAAESIHSDNVVATFDYREVEDPHGPTFCFMAMEFIRGESLADLLAREGSLPEALALDVLEQAAWGLSAIHDMDMVHRDIKPGNVLITETGQVKITDFGIAKAAAAVPLTRTGMVVGTAQYVSPEQAQGMEVSAASDIYSLGVVGYEMLSGSRPFTGDSSVSVALAHINQHPDPLDGGISAHTRELIEHAMTKDARRRYGDGNEFASAVSAVRLGQRPPRPRSADLAQLTAAYTPSSPTQALADATVATTVHPAAPRQVAAAAAAPAVAAAGDGPVTGAHTGTPRSSTAKSLGTGILIALAAAAAVGSGYWAVNFFTNSSQPSPAPAPHTVTEWVEPEPEPDTPEPEPSPQPEPERITITPEPQTITVMPEPQPSPQPEPEAPAPEPPAPSVVPSAPPAPAPAPAPGASAPLPSPTDSLGG